MIKKIINKHNIQMAYLVSAIFTLGFILFHKGQPLVSGEDFVNLFLKKEFLISFIIYFILIYLYVLLIKFALESIFNAFIKLIGEDPSLIVTFINKKQTVYAFLAVLLAKMYDKIIYKVIELVTDVLPNISVYLTHGSYSKHVYQAMTTATGVSNKLLFAGIILLSGSIGSTMYLGHVKKMKIVKHQIIEPLTLLVRYIPYISLLIFIFYVFTLCI